MNKYSNYFDINIKGTSGVYIPTKLYVGIIKKQDFQHKHLIADISNAPLSYITCRYADNSMLHASVFKRLVGYNPTTSRDTTIEFMKAVDNSVNEIDNVPVSGLRLASLAGNPYQYSGTGYESNLIDVLIIDPRGFSVAVPYKAFLEMLIACGCTMKDGVLSGEFVYADYFKTGQVVPISTSSENYEFSAKQSELERARRKVAVSQANLEEGGVYKLENSEGYGYYMYVGRADTYSIPFHQFAFKTGKYSLSEFDKCITPYQIFKPLKNAYVFYKMDELDELDELEAQKVSKLFLIKAKITPGFFAYKADPSEYQARNIPDFDKPATLENIREYMKINLIFNKIDLKRNSSTYSPVSRQLLHECMTIYADRYMTLGYTNGFSTGPCITKSTKLRQGGIDVGIKFTYDSVRSLYDRSIQKEPKNKIVVNVYNQKDKTGAARLSYIDPDRSFFGEIDDIFDQMNLEIRDYWFENGNKLSEKQVLMLD